MNVRRAKNNGKVLLKENKVDINNTLFDKYINSSNKNATVHKSINKKVDVENAEVVFTPSTSSVLVSLYNSTAVRSSTPIRVGLNSSSKRLLHNSNASNNLTNHPNLTVNQINHFFPNNPNNINPYPKKPSESAVLPTYNYPANIAKSAPLLHSTNDTTINSSSFSSNNNTAEGEWVADRSSNATTNNVSTRLQWKSADAGGALSQPPLRAHSQSHPADPQASQHRAQSAPSSRRKSVRFAQELVSYYSDVPVAPLMHSQSAKMAPQSSSLFVCNEGGSSNNGRDNSVLSNNAVVASFSNTPFSTPLADQEMYVLSDHSTQSAPASYPPTSLNRPVSNNTGNNAYIGNTSDNTTNTMPSDARSQTSSMSLFKHSTLTNATSGNVNHRILQGQGVGLMGNYQQLAANSATSNANTNPTANNTINTTSSIIINNSAINSAPTVMVGSTSSLLRQYGRTKQPSTSLSDSSHLPVHGSCSSRNDISSLFNSSNCINENGTNNAISASSTTTNTTTSATSTSEDSNLNRSTSSHTSSIAGNPHPPSSLLYRMPTKSFSIGSILCRQPAVAANTVAFYSDRLEYTFTHPFATLSTPLYSGQNSGRHSGGGSTHSGGVVVLLAMPFSCLKSPTVQGSKFRFQITKDAMLSNASVSPSSSTSTAPSHSSASSSMSVVEYFDSVSEVFFCSVEFTSMINIAIVREKVVPLIHQQQQLS